MVEDRVEDMVEDRVKEMVVQTCRCSTYFSLDALLGRFSLQNTQLTILAEDTAI